MDSKTDDEGVDVREGTIGLYYFIMAGATDGEIIIVEERTFGLYVAIEEGRWDHNVFKTARAKYKFLVV
jgi:hypothetical protein